MIAVKMTLNLFAYIKFTLVHKYDHIINHYVNKL
jgi:hypothetical protein